MTTTTIDAPRGLKNVVVTTTQVGDVLGTKGRFHYRGYDAIELARTASFEQAWYLMAHGSLPAKESQELAAFGDAIGKGRKVGAGVLRLVADLARADAAPLAILRTAVSALGATSRARATYDMAPDEIGSELLHIAAATPTILAAAYRAHHGLAPIVPDPNLPHAVDYLRMVTGATPSDRDAALVERYLIATIDHGFNNSTFTARVTASSGSDIASCLTSAIGSFCGPLHGGAPDRALQALDDIGDPANTETWVRRKLANGEKIMGFGHAVYRTHDPRAEFLKEQLAPYPDDLIARAFAVERAIEQALAEGKGGHTLYANVEFYAGVVMSLAGLTPEMFTPTFCVARMVGWAANVAEQAAEGKIIRPIARYVGPIQSAAESPTGR